MVYDYCFTVVDVNIYFSLLDNKKFFFCLSFLLDKFRPVLCFQPVIQMMKHD